MQNRDELAWAGARVLNRCGVRPMAILTPEHYREPDPLLTAMVDVATVCNIKHISLPRAPIILGFDRPFCYSCLL